MDYNPERTMQDMKQWNQGLIGKVFYELDPTDKNKFRTVRVAWNGFANKITPQVSNWHHGTPPEGSEPYHPKIMQAVTTAQPLHQGEFY